MQKFETVTGKAIPINRSDVDTDQIIPAQYLKRIERTGFGPFAFEQWRKDPEFVVNNPAYDGASIMITGPNFGCGSSREHAPWALEGLGMRVLIGTSFADIFRNNCAKIGLLTIALPKKDIDHLMARHEELPGAQIVVDLATQTVSSLDGSFVRKFDISPFIKNNLINGLDDIGLTMLEEDTITAFEAQRENALFPVTA